MRTAIQGFFLKKAEVLVNGKRCPVIGRICMDQLVLDVSHAGNVREGDIVTLIGRDGNEEITADELASLFTELSAMRSYAAYLKECPEYMWTNDIWRNMI